MKLGRKYLIQHYSFSDDFIKLYPTNHCLQRLEERGVGYDCIPTMVKITKNNIYCGELVEGKLVNVVIRLDYNRKYLFLAFNPVRGSLMTLWFKQIKKGAYSSL